MAPKEAEEIDIIAEAYQQARKDSQRTYAGAVKVLAPAKVNLHLAVGAKRADGYHNVVNVMHALALHDVVYVRLTSGTSPQGLQVETTCVSCEGVAAPDCPSEDNLATRAIVSLAQATGHAADPDAFTLRIEKHIPHQAGLGGGSSDAAAALVAAAAAWGLAPNDPCVVEVAQKLGADVAFFLLGGCVRLDGVGEHFAGNLNPKKGNLVLVKPEGGLSTAAVYKAFDQAPTSPADADAQAAASAANADAVPLFNGLAPAAEGLMPQLAQVRTWLQAQPGCTSALLCGSGACTFAEFDTFEHACAAATAAKLHDWWARTTQFSSMGAVALKN